MQPLVSIIIPTFNRSHIIGETLNSVLSQTYSNWECLVIDDGSTDDTNKIINKYSKKDTRVAYYHRPKGKLKGANACRNYGFEICKGQYVIFLDSDDFLLPFCIKTRMGFIEQNQDLDFIVFKEEKILSNGKTRAVKNYHSYSEKLSYLYAFLSYRIPWGTTGPIWKRASLTKYKWDEKLLRLQDVDFHIKILKDNQLAFEFVDETTSVFRAAEKSKGKSEKHIEAVLTSYLVFLKNHLQWVVQSDVCKTEFKKLIIFFNDNYLIGNTVTFQSRINNINECIALSNIFNHKDYLLLKIYSFYNKRIRNNKKVYFWYKFRTIFNNYFNFQ